MLKATLLKAAGSPTLQRQVTSNPIARRVAASAVVPGRIPSSRSRSPTATISSRNRPARVASAAR